MRRPQTYTARRLRREMSLPEVLLWNGLRRNGEGLRFRRQHPIGPYVVDFYHSAARLVIEIDGIAHDMGDRPARDEARQGYLEKNGYTVIRLPAADVLKNADDAADKIVRAVNPLHHQPAAGGPPPRAGEDSA